MKQKILAFHSKLILFATVLLCSVSAISQCSNVTNSQPALWLTIQQVHNTAKLGNPVLVSAVLTNNSEHDVSIWRAPGFEYGVDVRDEKKDLAPDTELGRYRNGHVDFSKLRPEDVNAKYLNGSGACFTLKSGKSLNDVIDVSRLYELAPGKYSIQLNHGDPTAHENVMSNAVTITVVP